MTRERFTSWGVLALIASAVLIIIGALIVWKSGRLNRIWNTAPTAIEQPKSYLRQETFQSGTSTQDQLLQSFRDGVLLQAGAWDMPGRPGSSLVLATPTITGKEERVVCGQSHPFCGLYLATPTSTSLVIWGGRLNGLETIERFPDADHVILGFAWSFLAFTSVEHRQLDLRTGEMIPLLMMELDTGYDSADLQVSGRGQLVKVSVTGHSKQSRIIPERVTVGDDERISTSLDTNNIARLVGASESAQTPLAPIVLLPSDRDLDGDEIRLLLFGVPYQLNMKQKTLTAQVSF